MEPKRKRALIAIGSAAGAVIAIAAIVIPLAIDANTTKTSVDALAITNTPPTGAGADGGAVAPEPEWMPAQTVGVIGELNVPLNSGMNRWDIPVDAPLSTMPTGSMCPPEQLEWLKKHAFPSRPPGEPVGARVHNTADAGTSLSLTNVRLDGTLKEEKQVVEFQCGGEGGGGFQVIELSLDGSPGVWGEVAPWGDAPQPVGSIATLTLAPGEVVDVEFRIEKSTTQTFTGRVIADIAGSEPDAVVLVDEFTLPRVPVPGYSIQFPEGTALTCQTPDGPFYQCTYAQAEELLREAGQR